MNPPPLKSENEGVGHIWTFLAFSCFNPNPQSQMFPDNNAIAGGYFSIFVNRYDK